MTAVRKRFNAFSYMNSPSRTGNTRDTVLWFNFGLVDRDFGKATGILVPFKRMCDNTGYVDLAAKVAGKVALARMIRPLW